MRLALLQSRHQYWNAETALSTLRNAISEASEAGAELLVTAELYLSGYGDPEQTQAMAEPIDGPFISAARDLCVDAGVGLIVTYPEQAGTECFNSAAVINASGDMIANYRKINLANDYERSCFSAGTEQVLFDFNGVRCAVVICYDVEFPEVVRKAALAGAQLVIAPSALSTKWRFTAESLIPTRAYENGIFVAYVNFSEPGGSPELCGLSTIAGPDGQVVAHAGQGTELLIGDIDLDQIDQVRAQLHFLRDLRH